MNSKQRYLLKHPERRKETLRKWHLKRKSLRPWETSYFAARARCVNSNHDYYPWYGAKGIKFEMSCNDFKNLCIRDKASLMKKPSIDRIDSKGNYEFSNCRFIEQSENSRRKRKFDKTQITEIRELYVNGKLKCKVIAKNFGVDKSTIYGILRGEYYSDFS